VDNQYQTSSAVGTKVPFRALYPLVAISLGSYAEHASLSFEQSDHWICWPFVSLFTV
jgi:hypothetical protein